MNGRIENALNPVFRLGGNLLESVKQLNAVDVLVTAGLVYTVLKIGDYGVKMYHAVTDVPTLTPADKEKMRSDNEDTLQQVAQAENEMADDSLPMALMQVNDAFRKFNSNIRQFRGASDLKENKMVMVKFHYLRAQIYYLQGEYALAEKELLGALKLDQTFLLANNLLIHLYLNQLPNEDNARKYITQSIALKEDQPFIRYCQAMLKADVGVMTDISNSMMKIYHDQYELSEQADRAHQQTKEWIRLHKSMPSIVLPFMLLKEMEIKIAGKETSQLLQMTDTFSQLLQEQTAIMSKSLRVMLKEGRIKALLRVAELRKFSDQFTEVDKKLCQQHGLVCKDLDKYYMDYSGERIDHAVTDLFELGGTNTEYLYSAAYRASMAEIIKGWARSGWLDGDSDEKIKTLCGLLQQLKHESNNEELSREVLALSMNAETIKYFIQKYIEGEGWKPWLKVVCNHDLIAGGPMLRSLLRVACMHQGVSLNIYARTPGDSVSIGLYDQMNPVGVESKHRLHVLYDPINAELRPMHEISTPSRLYRWMALSECWDLLKHQDPANKYAFELMGSQGLAILPEIAIAKLADEFATPATHQAVINGLTLFIKRSSEFTEGKELAESVIANHQRETKGSYGGLFSARNFTLSVVGGTALAGIIYLAKK